MWQISFNDLVISVLSITLLLLGVFHCGRVISSRAAKRRAKRVVMQCDVCGNLYQNPEGLKILPCPACGRDNRRGRDKSLG
ncbi:hypothetical protein [Rubritalea marina]|uniref:hypothetical protein n=1 Tax=Rubritalea marina TaxID=361055 RepID=UPI00036F2D52|nr:hypothetical protein [Rubritalea marina]